VLRRPVELAAFTRSLSYKTLLVAQTLYNIPLNALMVLQMPTSSHDFQE
jgi:hypothetical protein